MHIRHPHEPLTLIVAAIFVCLAALCVPISAHAAEYAPAQSLGKPDGMFMGCPSGSFWDPRNGGECWKCSTGKRSVFAVDGPKACTVEGFTSFAPATQLEQNKSQCPKGSFFDVGKGSCWSCPSGSKRTVFPVDGGKACERITPKQKRKADYVYKVSSVFKSCRSGTFANAGSRSCYTCPKGWKHDPSKRVKTSGVCYKPRKVSRMAATEVYDVSLSCNRGFFDPIDGGSCWTCPANHVRQVSSVKSSKACMQVQKPTFSAATFVGDHRPDSREVIKGASQMGCANKGRDAFFDPINGGSCWSCPSGNPERSLYPVNGNKACMATTCGKEGGRPCLVWERIPSCDKGLAEDFLNNQCRHPKNLACNSYVTSVAALSDAIDVANETGEQLTSEVIDRIPGAKLLLQAMARKMQELQEEASKVQDKLPLDEAMAPMDRFIEDHEDQIRIVTNMAKQAQNTREQLRKVLLDPDLVCTDDTGGLDYQLTSLGFRELATPSRRQGIQMSQRQVSGGPPRAMMVSARPQPVAREEGLLRHHRITFDYSLSLPAEQLANLVGVTPPKNLKAPLSLGVQIATNFQDRTKIYFSHGFGLGASAEDPFTAGGPFAELFGMTGLSVGFQYNGRSEAPCTDDNAYGWGFAFNFTDWLTIGINPQNDPIWSGFAIALPQPQYGWGSDPFTILTASAAGATPVGSKPSFSMSYPELKSIGGRYDATAELGSVGNSCGPIH